MTKKVKISNFVRYDKNTKRWIPYRYVLYNYWWSFLKIAYQEKREVDWKFYEDWGKPEEIFSITFQTWFRNNKERLFEVDGRYENPTKFIMSSKQAKPDPIKVALEVYRIKEKENGDILDILQKKYPKKMSGLSNPDFNYETKEVNRTIKRFRNQSESILKNVCEGKFP